MNSSVRCEIEHNLDQVRTMFNHRRLNSESSGNPSLSNSTVSRFPIRSPLVTNPIQIRQPTYQNNTNYPLPQPEQQFFTPPYANNLSSIRSSTRQHPYFTPAADRTGNVGSNPPMNSTPPSNGFGFGYVNSGEALNEVRSLFQNRERSGRGASAPRSASGGARVSRIQDSWDRAFFCLPFKNSKSPTPLERRTLSNIGLGKNAIICSHLAGSQQLESSLREAFPLLGSNQFTLCVSDDPRKTGGYPMYALDRNTRVPSVRTIKCMAGGRKLLYILPDEDIITEEQIEEAFLSSTTQDEALTTTAATTTTRGDNAITTEVNGPHVEITTNSSSAAAGGFNFRPQISTPVVGSALVVDERTLFHIDNKIRIFSNDDILTIDHLRNNILEEITEIHNLTVGRDYLVELKVIYGSDINLLRKTNIRFENEPGIDLGALSKEYFWLMMDSILHNKLRNTPLFEGTDDHKVPSDSLGLVMNKIFKYVGKFFIHAILGTNIGLPGLSPACAYYITHEEGICSSIMEIEDIPDFNIQEIMKKVVDWNMEENYILNTVEPFLQEIGYEGPINIESNEQIKEYVLIHEIILKRKAALDAIKDEFREFGFLEFLKSREFLVSSIFPSDKSMMIPKEAFFRALSGMGESCDEAIQDIKYFVDTSNDPFIVNKLALALTGFPRLPSKLYIKYVDDPTTWIDIHTCSSEIWIPRTMPRAELCQQLTFTIELGCVGFGKA